MALMREGYYSHAGYAGALTIFLAASSLVYAKSSGLLPLITEDHIFSMVGVMFLVMLVSEWFFQRRYRRKSGIAFVPKALHAKNSYILRSAILRFSVLFIPFLLFYAIVQNHYYFTNAYVFRPTRHFFDILLYIFAIGGVPYIFLTLKFNGDKRHEIGDYAMITLAAIRSLSRHAAAKILQKPWPTYRLHRNRRVKKVLLLYLVNFFFLTLMVRFVVQEFHGFEKASHTLFSERFGALGWYQQYKTLFLLLFHLLFTIDVSIAIVGYSFASRWLFNRTRSVDATLSGWMAALVCYPPFNTITTQFFGYTGLPTHNLFSDERILALILTIVILLYMLYVWATVALGFKFSNLTNRGIVDRGPYALVRHPAYVAKNSAWWMDNTFVLTNIWATIALAIWNVIYILRAVTEERHLLHDRDYKRYCENVRYRFIPKII